MIDLRHLASSGYLKKNNDIIRIQAGQYFFRKNDIGKDMFIILSGETDIILDDDYVIATSKAGDILGEMTFLENLPRSASAKAKTDVLALVINSNNFERIIKKHPSFALDIMRSLSKRIRAQNEKI